MADIQAAPSVQPEAQPAAPKQKSKIEILAEIKKLLDKNGIEINEEVIIGLLDSMKKGILPVQMTAERTLFELQAVQPILDNQRILVFPRGKFWIQKYQRNIEFNDLFFNDVEKNFVNVSLSKPYIDKNHEHNDSFGNILNWERDKNGLYGIIKLNQFGIDLVKQGVFSSISPCFGDIEDNKGNKIKNYVATISLTNEPALMGNLPVLQEQMNLSFFVNDNNKRRSNKMNELTYKGLSKFVSLAAEVSPDAVMAAMPEILKALEDLTAKVQELTGQAVVKDEKIAAQDAANAQMNSQLTTIRVEQLTKEANEVIQKAVELGKYNPSEKFIELKKAEYIENPEKIKKELSLIPENKALNNLTTGNKETMEELTFSDEDLEIIKASGKYDLNKIEDRKLAKKALEE